MPLSALLDATIPRFDSTKASTRAQQHCVLGSLLIHREPTELDGYLNSAAADYGIGETIEAGADYFPVDLRVISNGKPLVGAEITLVPEPFLGEGYPSYSGTTIEGGFSPLESDGKDLPGIPAGFYQAKIVHPGQGIDVVRGVEIADDTTGNRLEIAL